MPGFGLNVELDVGQAFVKDIGAIAFDWFDTVSRMALAEPRAALEAGGPVPQAPRFVEPASWNPSDAPVHLRGSLSVSSRRSKAFDDKAMAWLRDRLVDSPERVEMSFALFAGTEPDAPSAWWPSLYVHQPQDSPQWLRLGSYVPEKTLVDERHGANAQRLWLDVVRSFAEKLDPGFGQVEYGFDTQGTTALEWSLPSDLPLEDRLPSYTVAQCRKFLRGYSWLTVVPAELAERLGGAAALQRTGAFAEVSALQAGGVWLLATEDYRDYGPEHVAGVFRALAPVLRPGLPEPMDDVYGDPPQRLVFEDAAGALRVN